MTKKIALFVCLFLSIIFNGGKAAEEKNLLVGYLNPAIEYQGRIDTSTAEGAKLYWSGTSIKLNFEGCAIKALFREKKGDNYYNVFVDNNEPFILRPDTTKKYYQLASNLSVGKHSVLIFKRTEWNRGEAVFGGFEIDGSAKVLPKDPAKSKKIEFYGNSISAGYAVEDTSGRDRSDSTFTNNYLSYTAIIARHYNAQYRCICKSGIGITISWFPIIMPEIYDRINPEDSSSRCDFSQYEPDVVVVNLFQNDSWLVKMPQRAEFKANFGTIPPSDEYLINAYQKFVASIRGHYPKAKIICILGSMDATKKGSQWPGYIKSAVANLHDSGIYTHFIPFKNTSGHPSIKEQQDMANNLIEFIDKNIEW